MYVAVNSVGNIFISLWASYELTVLANEPDAGMRRQCVVFNFFILHSVLVMNRGNGIHFYSYDSDISCYAVMGNEKTCCQRTSLIVNIYLQDRVWKLFEMSSFHQCTLTMG